MDAVSATIVVGGQARFRQHREASINYFNVYINLIDLVKLLNGGLRKHMWMVARHLGLGDVDSSNLHPRRGWWLCHHGVGVCCVFELCAVVSSGCRHSLYVKEYERITLR
jgi:hypothetical protein